MTGSPPVRRIVTGHDAAGRAVFTADDLLPVSPIPSGDAAFSLIWTTACVPADNNDDTDGRSRDAGLTLHQGSVIRIVDMLPGGVSPFHRSSSIDYGIVLSGAVELEAKPANNYLGMEALMQDGSSKATTVVPPWHPLLGDTHPNVRAHR